jgi:[acyl-carrier-protein] S-malonyltransferase
MAVSLAMFPGQGSQQVGMGRDLLEQFPRLGVLFEEAEDAARIPIRKFCLEGPEGELVLTAHQQPCLLTVSYAMWRALCEETGWTPSWFAGHSLGEYSALVASGRLSFAKAVYLVRQRGLFMQEAVAQGGGAMLAIMGSNLQTVVPPICEDMTRIHKKPAEVANYNSPEQWIVSGAQAPVEAVGLRCKEAKLRVIPLPVSAPFHSSLMAPAREKMAPLLSQTPLSVGTGHILANYTGQEAASYSTDLLLTQIDHPVLWMQSMQAAYEQGVRRFVEIGPGKVLSGLVRRCVGADIEVHTAGVGLVDLIKSLR